MRPAGWNMTNETIVGTRLQNNRYCSHFKRAIPQMYEMCFAHLFQFLLQISKMEMERDINFVLISTKPFPSKSTNFAQI